jgi:transposase
MRTEEFFDVVLCLGREWRVAEVIKDELECCVSIHLEYCGEAVPYDFAPARRWRHLDMLQYKSYIHARLPRFKSADGRVVTASVPWANKHERHTYLFEAFVIEVLLATFNQSKTASLVRCSFDVVNRIMHLASERGMERRKKVDERLEHLSIDEKSFRKGHNYVTILSDPVQGRILEVVEDRTQNACKRLIQGALSQRQRLDVKTISMDMWKASLTTAHTQLPNAQVVHDKFHLIAYLSKAIDQVRRRETRDHPELKGTRYALLKNEGNLTDRQRAKFEAIRQTNLQVSKAWQARENFKDAFNNETASQGRAIFEEWLFTTLQSGIKEVVDVAIMFSNHINGIISAMTTKLNNAMAERLNGKIQLLKMSARGYRTFHRFRSAILFFNGKLNLSPLNSE